jgi:hypothetical protein
MAQQTAIEFYDQALRKCLMGTVPCDPIQILEQANQMFQEQIIETWKHGNLPTFLGRALTAEEYYNETYGK